MEFVTGASSYYVSCRCGMYVVNMQSDSGFAIGMSMIRALLVVRK
jgi:hypothetical protein